MPKAWEAQILDCAQSKHALREVLCQLEASDRQSELEVGGQWEVLWLTEESEESSLAEVRLEVGGQWKVLWLTEESSLEAGSQSASTPRSALV